MIPDLITSDKGTIKLSIPYNGGTNMALIFTDENFEKEVIQSDLPVLVDFYADWCGPCKMMAPIIEELHDQYEGKIKIGKLNVDNSPETAAAFRVMSIPTLIFFKNGKAIETMVGVVAKQKLEDFFIVFLYCVSLNVP